MHRGITVIAISCGITAAALAQEPPEKPRRVLPGVRPGGFIQLPNQWSLKPAGFHLEVGDFPVNMALHPGGRWLAILHAGYGEHEIMIVDASSRRVANRVPIEQTFYGLCFAPDGKALFASGGEYALVHEFAFEDGLLTRRRATRLAGEKERFITGGLATDPAGKNLYVAAPWGDKVCIVSLEDQRTVRTIPLEREDFPYTCLADPAGGRVYVSLWNRAAIAVLDPATGKREAIWRTESHPTEMALAGGLLYVACANSTKVSVIDTKEGKGLETISCALFPTAPSGNTPNSLCLTPDGQLLFVANADANNIAVFNVAARGKARPLGFIPAGWYPTSVRYGAADRRLYFANGKGTTPRANPKGPDPNLPANQTIREYIAGLYRGTVGILDLPTPEQMARFSKEAYACSPLQADARPVGEIPAGHPIPRRLGDPSPIKHCLYIVKENRTYDQVFGDIKEGNGDPDLCLFPEEVTPNHHKIAREFVLLDNFYVDGEVSADGHEWSMGAYASDFVEKSWPLSYRPGGLKKIGYPAEGNYDAIARGAGGYIWDRCAEAGVSYRSYGEWIINGKKPGDPGRASVKALEGHFDPYFWGYDLDYPDQKRADRFIEELKRFEQEGSLPRFIVLRLPNDHTSGTRVGKPTPRAMVADNDLALGRVIEAVTKSKFWKETAVFVVEDDAQNGPDHVDAHRTVALVVSPYTRRRYVDSTMYSTSSMLRTMELILGLKPMSQFDAAARPMVASFQTRPDFTPYEHVPARVSLEEKNPATAWGAALSESFNLAREDAADDLLFNEVIWRSVKGADSPMPPPVRAAFVFPHIKEK